MLLLYCEKRKSLQFQVFIQGKFQQSQYEGANLLWISIDILLYFIMVANFSDIPNLTCNLKSTYY